ncbi:MAG: biotin carboxyl carrier domain-containing protein [Chloroflexota bacterium]|nr:biotin carboxyl carrier domain-containing protein [Chloroflexota bacterium]
MAEEDWLAELRQLICLLAGTSIAEIELDDGDLHLSIKRQPRPACAGDDGPAPTERLEEPEDSDHLAYVSAPLLGTFYRAPAPGAPPLVREGEQVEKGQVVGLIEAMKIFNEIQAEVSGLVRAILVEDGAFVEANQHLLAIETQAAEDERDG